MGNPSPVTSSPITDDAAKVKSSATITSSHTTATANGVHGFHWFTVCAPAGWDPASEEWEVCPCGWRPELRKHYAKASHVQWWREQIKERGSLEAVYREVRRRQREYRDTDAG